LHHQKKKKKKKKKEKKKKVGRKSRCFDTAKRSNIITSIAKNQKKRYIHKEKDKRDCYASCTYEQHMKTNILEMA